MLDKLLNNNRGSVLFVVVIATPIILGILLLAIDLGKNQSAYTNNQGGVDSAALGAADFIIAHRITNETKKDPSNLTEYAFQQYLQNTDRDQTFFEVEGTSFEVEALTNRVTVKACVESPNHFTSYFGLQSDFSIVCNDAQASIPTIGHVEIALALDVTSSMLEEVNVAGRRMTKIEALKEALVGNGNSNGLLNKQVVKDSAIEGGIYWSVVPFRGMVDLGANAKNIVADDWNANAIERDFSDYENVDREFGNIARLRTNERNVGWDAYNEAVERASGGRYAEYDSFRSGNKARHIYNDPDERGAIKDYYHDNARGLLGRVALTERLSGDNSLSDDIAPTGNDKFKAYWHHPRKYWMAFPAGGSSVAWRGTCDQCIQTGRYRIWLTSSACSACPTKPPSATGEGEGEGTGTGGSTGDAVTPPVVPSRPYTPRPPTMDNK